MSILYSPSFNHPDGKLGNNQDDLELNYRHYHHHLLDNSGLLRYRSAPSSFLVGLVDGTVSPNSDGDVGQGVGGEEYSYFGSSNSNVDTSLPRFLPTYSGSGDSDSHHLRKFGERTTVVKQEATDLEMAYPNLSGHDVANDDSMRIGYMDGRFSVGTAVALENSAQSMKGSPANASTLIRQHSSPARTFSDLNFDDGFCMARDFGGLKSCSSTNGELGDTTGMPSNQVDFSSPRLLPQIAEIGCNRHDSSSPDNRISKRQFIPCFENDNWDDTSLDGLKRQYPDRSLSSGLNNIDNQNRNPDTCFTGLTHHLSLPKTVAEMATIEKLAQFQGSAPCKFRAKRGFATHPRSIAERVRRTRISERMRKLQDLFPDMDKQTNKADMLDLAIEYIKDLQKQVKNLKDCKVKCSCSSKQRQY